MANNINNGNTGHRISGTYGGTLLENKSAITARKSHF